MFFMNTIRAIREVKELRTDITKLREELIAKEVISNSRFNGVYGHSQPGISLIDLERQVEAMKTLLNMRWIETPAKISFKRMTFIAKAKKKAEK